MGTWLRRLLSLDRAKSCGVYVLTLILYQLSVLLLPKGARLAPQRSLSKVFRRGREPMVRRNVCDQRLRNGGLGMIDLESDWLAERLAFLG